ncbi:MAG TPA: FAD-binding oxidoreductase, partial [Acidimicrobiia bacterium]|nr:FAD-binding oxidoreductase [Acidimicrobiia bacterium]
MTSLDDALGAFRALLGPEHVLTEPDMVAGYVHDWTGRWSGHTPAVLRPGSVDEVQEVVRICHEHSLPLVPQGGNTGLVGGSIPHQGEMVLSLRRLDRIGPVDERRREVTVGAGVTVGALHTHARRAGLEYGVDLSSRDSATIGGTIATNAGGMNVVANGDTRQQVLGLEVVLADGSLVSRLGGMAKQSIGPDLVQLMVGSEGTLGVITAARLRLIPRLETEPMVILVGVETLGEGLAFLDAESHALEFFDRACLETVIAHRRLSRPLPADHPFYVLVETTSPPDLVDGLEAVVDRRLWSYRESITETVNQIGVPVKLDVAVPLGRVDEFAAAVDGLGLEGQVFLYGHLAEGNFHVNVVGNPDPESVVDQVLAIVIGLDGVIASEHGIGLAKSLWWRRSTDPATLAMHQRVKEAFDPGRILN